MLAMDVNDNAGCLIPLKVPIEGNSLLQTPVHNL